MKKLLFVIVLLAFASMACSFSSILGESNEPAAVIQEEPAVAEKPI